MILDIVAQCTNTTSNSQGCRNCNRDNKDGRLLASMPLDPSPQSLFETAFLSNVQIMDNKITAAVTNGLKVYPCLGRKPKVEVTVQVVSLWELAVQCAGEVVTSGLLPFPVGN